MVCNRRCFTTTMLALCQLEVASGNGLGGTCVAVRNFPGETFRVLKEKESHQYGEYRTCRLVLEAWEQLNGTKGDEYNGLDLKG